MAKIVKMDAALANLIAAGEVVEKPSSVVKELVENAIDASASQINIYTTESGTLEIKVVDNGDGMSAEDVSLAFLRHATSKIKNEYDLLRIQTLGFRGEAIPSIAAVSNMQIYTNDGSGGYQVTYKGGSIQSQGEFACKKGTTVSVKNLFFNTPARLKFIKSLTKELSSIVFLVNKFAITHPEISFTYYNNDKLLLRTSGNNNFEQLFAEIYGLNVAKNIKIIDFEADGCKVKAVIAKPEIYRSSKNDITLIANGRYVKSSAITQAVMDAYYTRLPIGKAPLCAIYLDIDPVLVDVNVHPTKIEIKISNEENICAQLKTQIEEALENVVQIPQRQINTNKAYIKEQLFDKVYEEVEIKKAPVVEVKNTVVEPKNEEVKYEVKQEKPIVKLEEKKETVYEFIERKIPYMEYIGQALGCYLIFQNQDGLYLVDQHAAAERIRYEYYSKLLNDEKQPITKLLFPVEIELANDDLIIAKDSLDIFKDLGISLSFENKVISLSELPMWLKQEKSDDVVRQIIELIKNNRNFDLLFFRDSIAKQISCKSSIKANHRISVDEVNSLIKDLNKCKDPYHCPHGRPTIINLSNDELEKMFERIVV